jgi:hypothetical protein
MSLHDEADQYRYEAARCRQMATRTADAGLREQLRRIADTYDSLARQLDELGQSRRPGEPEIDS